jgi:L-lactate utilization protein LutB
VLRFETLPAATLEQLATNCRARGFETELLPDRQAAFRRLLELIPPVADVHNGSSMTLYDIGFMDYLRHGDHRWRYRRGEILAENDEATRRRLRREACTAEYFVGGLNALAVTGEAVAADHSGSRVGGYVFAAEHVIWVVGTNKVVPTLADAIDRVRTVATPLEDQRMRDLGGDGTTVGKLVIFEHETIPGRVRLLLVDEALGY